jgi:hypothetical protein
MSPERKKNRTLAVHGYHGTSAGLDSESKRHDEGSVIRQSSIVHDDPEFHIFHNKPESQQKRASTDAENYSMTDKKNNIQKLCDIVTINQVTRLSAEEKPRTAQSQALDL